MQAIFRAEHHDLVCQDVKTVGRQYLVGLSASENFHIRAGLLLGGIGGQETSENGGMRGVDDDQFRECVRVRDSEGPGHEAAPVMAYEDELLAAREMIREGANVFDQDVEPILTHIVGLIGKIEAAHIEPDGMVVFAKLGELVPPRVPEFREAVQKQDEWAFSRTDIVQSNTVCLDGRRFTTAVLAEYEPATRRLSYVNAGHNAPILRRANGDMEKLDIGGVPLGIHAAADYESSVKDLNPGDALIFFTDGVVEAFDESGAEFGNDRWLAAIRTLPEVTAQESLQFLMTRVDAFVGATRQSDDITCMIFRAKRTVP